MPSAGPARLRGSSLRGGSGTPIALRSDIPIACLSGRGADRMALMHHDIALRYCGWLGKEAVRISFTHHASKSR